MSFSKLCQYTRVSLTYCRQNAFKSQHKRSFCVSTAWHEDANVASDIEEAINARKRKANIAIISNEAQDTVLNFFNNCDHVTLNKLLKYKKRRYQGFSFEQVYKVPYTESRYSDLEDFLEKTGLTHNRIEDMATLIQQFEKAETKSTIMTFLQPNFNRVNVEDIDKVVALDMFQSNFAWCVRDVKDNYITDIGFTPLGLSDTYNHVDYHKQIRMFLETIPKSEVYLLNSTSLMKTTSKKVSKFLLNQISIEAIVTTLLNERHLPKALPSDHLEDHSRERFLNKVHLYQPLVLQEMYEISFRGELLPPMEIFKAWYKNNHPILEKWGLTAEERRELFYSKGCSQVAICTLMTDMFSRYICKRSKQFPQAYS